MNLNISISRCKRLSKKARVLTPTPKKGWKRSQYITLLYILKNFIQVLYLAQNVFE
jgi:hypothetical protein